MLAEHAIYNTTSGLQITSFSHSSSFTNRKLLLRIPVFFCELINVVPTAKQMPTHRVSEHNKRANREHNTLVYYTYYIYEK